jgi:peptide/nickel transport system substrate-binding protein
MGAVRHTLRTVGATAAAVLALTAAGCAIGANAAASSTGVKGGVATFPIDGVAPNWIWPFTPITDYGVANVQQFQWLMYRPLYMFGNNGDSTMINYALSPANAPVYSDGGKTVVISLKGWKWSDGEVVDAQDVVFWLNLMKAEKANYGGYAPGLLPDNLLSYRATGRDSVTLHLNQAYSSYWFTYNQLAEITPMPAAWDVTSLNAKPGSGGCAASVARCPAVYNFLVGQAKDTAAYTTSRIWRTVDGPWLLSRFSIQGDDAFVPNSVYSGNPKPQLSEFRLVTFPSDSAEYAALKAGKLDAAQIPAADLRPRAPGSALPATSPLGAGFTLISSYQYDINYYLLNFHNPTLGPVFSQLYVRQALQSVDDQVGMDAKIFRGYAVPTSGGVPTIPANVWEPAIEKANGGAGPYPFRIATARSLLTSHGWRQVGKVMTCQRPGIAKSDCGAGIAKGRKLTFTIDWFTGFATNSRMMAAYRADAARAGIVIRLVGQPFQSVIGESAPCTGPKCTWQAVYYGGWVFNGPGFEPTGESLFQTADGYYSNPTEDKLIGETHTSNSLAVFHQYATYTARQVPFIWMPNQYTIWGVVGRLHNVTESPLDTLLPEYWYFTQ